MTTKAGSDLFNVEAWQHSLAEFIVTLLFIFIGGGAVVASGIASGGALDTGRLVAIALAHGLAIALLVFATANVSGGHINPAVTFSMVVTRKISMTKGAMYVAAQLTGAIIGALLLMVVSPDAVEGNLGAHGLGNGITAAMGLLVEIILTFVLVFTVFMTAVDRRGAGNLAPLAIGFSILVIHLVAVPLTGAGVNPARSLGPAVAAGAWADHWIYWVGPLIGATLAGLVHQFLLSPRKGKNGTG
ncbi:MAG: aquaporin [SAR202 cluster bacterium]|nr:aquaporin [SAR202 cluster bacterium]